MGLGFQDPGPETALLGGGFQDPGPENSPLGLVSGLPVKGWASYIQILRRDPQSGGTLLYGVATTHC